MPIVKVNYFFDYHEQGWSETWYYNEPNTIEDTMVVAKDLGTKRARMLGNDARLVYIRCSDEAINGDSIVTTNVTNPDPLLNEPADPAWSGYVVRCEAGGNYRKVFCLRGIPKSIATANFYQLSNFGTWKPAFDEWALALQPKGSVWGCRVLDKTITNPRAAILNIQNDAANPGFLQFTTKGIQNLADGVSVRLSQIKYNPGGKALNGIYTVKFTGPDVFSIPGTLPAGAYTGKGYAWPRVYAIQKFDDVFIERLGSHKAGLPFPRRPGRRKTRV
jgi:hypothetical protein